MPRLIRVFAGRTCHFAGFVMRRLISSEVKSRVIQGLVGQVKFFELFWVHLAKKQCCSHRFCPRKFCTGLVHFLLGNWEIFIQTTQQCTWVSMSPMFTVIFLSLQTDRSGQTVQTWSGSTLSAIPSASFGCITLRKSYLVLLLGWLQQFFWGVRKFRKFTVW